MHKCPHTQNLRVYRPPPETSQVAICLSRFLTRKRAGRLGNITAYQCVGIYLFALGERNLNQNAQNGLHLLNELGKGILSHPSIIAFCLKLFIGPKHLAF